MTFEIYTGRNPLFKTLRLHAEECSLSFEQAELHNQSKSHSLSDTLALTTKQFIDSELLRQSLFVLKTPSCGHTHPSTHFEGQIDAFEGKKQCEQLTKQRWQVFEAKLLVQSCFLIEIPFKCPHPPFKVIRRETKRNRRGKAKANNSQMICKLSLRSWMLGLNHFPLNQIQSLWCVWKT